MSILFLFYQKIYLRWHNQIIVIVCWITFDDSTGIRHLMLIDYVQLLSLPFDERHFLATSRIKRLRVCRVSDCHGEFQCDFALVTGVTGKFSIVACHDFGNAKHTNHLLWILISNSSRLPFLFRGRFDTCPGNKKVIPRKHADFFLLRIVTFYTSIGRTNWIAN